jgi:hypothetical protein
MGEHEPCILLGAFGLLVFGGIIVLLMRGIMPRNQFIKTQEVFASKYRAFAFEAVVKEVDRKNG